MNIYSKYICLCLLPLLALSLSSTLPHSVPLSKQRPKAGAQDEALPQGGLVCVCVCMNVDGALPQGGVVSRGHPARTDLVHASTRARTHACTMCKA